MLLGKHDNKNNRVKDIYLILDSMATNVGNLFDTLGIYVDKPNEQNIFSYAKLLRYLITDLTMDKSIINKLIIMDDQIEEARVKADTVMKENKELTDRYNKLKDRYISLQAKERDMQEQLKVVKEQCSDSK